MSIEAIVNEFSAVAANPKGQLKAYKDAGKKCIGVMPYYAPEELVYAAGMMPFGMWGSNNKTEQRSKEYCATFYCTIAQLDLEMLLDGTMDLLDGEAYVEHDGNNYKKLVTRDNALKGFILMGNKIDRAGIYTSLIKEHIPLDEVDFEALKRNPVLMAFSRTRRNEKLAGGFGND